jgi:hypothetical protein
MNIEIREGSSELGSRFFYVHILGRCIGYVQVEEGLDGPICMGVSYRALGLRPNTDENDPEMMRLANRMVKLTLASEVTV